MIDSKYCWLKDSCKKNHCNDSMGCLILQKLDYLYNAANVPVELRKKKALYTDSDGTDLDKFMQLSEIKSDIVNWVQKGENLLLFSKQCGCGKTSWALKLLNEYFSKIWNSTDFTCRALFINVPNFLIAYKSYITDKNSYVQNILNNVRDCDLVIWDDIGNKNATDYEANGLLSMIEARLMNNKSNIFTSNLNIQEIHEALGDRLYSRICNYSTNIELKGGDKRNLK